MDWRAIFPTLLTLAFRLQSTPLLEALGQMTPGDDWQRFVPLMVQLPGWLHALLLAAGLCYVRRHPEHAAPTQRGRYRGDDRCAV